MKITSKIKKWLKNHSVKILGLGTTIQVTLVSIPPDILSTVPQFTMQIIFGLLMVLGVLGRFFGEEKQTDGTSP